MTADPPVVRVLVTDLSRTGVPVVLERMLRALPADRRGGVNVVAGRAGPLGSALRRLGVTVVELGPEQGRGAVGTVAAGLAVAGAPGLGRTIADVAARAAVRSLPVPDVVLYHGAGSALLRGAAPAGVPTVVHVHELATGLARSGPAAGLRAVLSGARRVVAVAPASAAAAVDAGAGPGRVDIVPGVVDPNAPGRRRAEARAIVGVADAVPVAGGAGRPGWRKGTGRLPTLARELGRVVGGGATTLWVGGRPPGPEADRLGVDDGVRWYDERDDPWAVLDAADVVVVPSREDPLPLAALEAGQRGLPVVATATGGLPDLLADGRGAVVGTHDLPGLAAEVGRLLTDADAASAAGEALRAHVARHHDVDVVVPVWWQVLVDAAGGRS